MPSPTDAAFTQDIKGCARCHGDGHDGLVFRKFEHAVEAYNVQDEMFNVIATHWSTCPINNEPILMTFFEGDIMNAAIEAERGA